MRVTRHAVHVLAVNTRLSSHLIVSCQSCLVLIVIVIVIVFKRYLVSTYGR